MKPSHQGKPPKLPKPRDPEAICLSPDNAALYIGLGRTKLWELLMSGTIPSFVVGRRRLVPREALEQFVRRHEHAVEAAAGPSK